MRLILLLLFPFLVLSCASKDADGKRLFIDEHGKNQYFDRLNEFADFGEYQDYQLMLDFDLSDVEGLLMSTSLFDYAIVPKNQSKTRRFVLVNPHDTVLQPVLYQVEGAAEFVIVKNTCPAILPERKICTIFMAFQPTSESSVGTKHGRLVIKYPTDKKLVKELRGIVY